MATKVLTVRLVNGDAPIARPTSSAERQKRVKQLGKSVAIVDDDEDLLLVITMMVRRLGYDIGYIAHSADEIIKAVRDGMRPDVIIMDYRMPGMNGLMAAGKILNINSELKIIVATADDSIEEQAISEGLFFLRKPFSRQLLAKTMENALP